MTPVPHPPYSTDLVPSDFFLVSRMTKVFNGKPFADVEEVKQKMAAALKSIKIHESKNCCEQWKKCLDRCVASDGEYFESD